MWVFSVLSQDAFQSYLSSLLTWLFYAILSMILHKFKRIIRKLYLNTVVYAIGVYHT